ncbi:MAG: TAT-variant-translocated molybdopterin oxidoreductase [Verrucomicrobiota bacterium JB023]|nr:TAT-variant-translocated molybdopterin oxidoreductase [Verrucomicrobiota bacterium JB023]
MSKRVWNHPEVPAEERDVLVWRSAGELDGSAMFREHLEREFPEKNGELTEEERELSRRSFVKLMGASSALAGLGLASCRRPESYIVPYTNAPEWVIPGKPLYYASARPTAAGGVPLLVTTFEGRPTLVAPNEDHPDSSGTDAFTQASILDLYDPDRSKDFLKAGKVTSKADFEAALKESAAKPGKIGFVFGEDDSPTRARLVGELKKKFPGAKAYRYEALEANRAEAALGKGNRLVVDFSKADRILSLDCDFLGLDETGESKGYFERRQGGSHADGKLYSKEVAPEEMNRHYQVEAAYTLTGGMADHRLRVTAGRVAQIASAIAAELGVSVPASGELSEKEKLWVAECAKDLQAAGGNAVVLAGKRQSAGLHQLAAAINAKLGSACAKIVATGRGEFADFAELVADMEAGALQTLVFATPANPVFDAPADVQFKELLAKVPTTIHLGLRADHTARACSWHVPAAHYLESWGDTRTASGSHLLVQPMILPLHGGVGELELLSAFLGDGSLQLGDEQTPSAGYDAVRNTVQLQPAAWTEALKNGYIDASYAEAEATGATDQVAASLQTPTPSKDALEVIFAADASVWDGRFINNSWLQEAPDPISKLTWDNVAYVSPKTAEALGIEPLTTELEPETKIFGKDVKNAPRPEQGEGEKAKAPMIEVKLGEASLKIPVLVSFGQADDTIVLPLGYGQGRDDGRSGGVVYDKAAPVVGQVGLNTGFDAYRLRTSQTDYLASGATISMVFDRYPVALTQEHHAMYGRALAREISTDDIDVHHHHKSYEEQLKGVAKQGMDSHMPPNTSIYKPNDTEGKPLISDDRHQWAMAIDLNVCTGCNSCLVACQAENNIPVVGKEQVAKGREMHWIRMDRYYAVHKDGDQDNPEMIPQPVACVQCEMAPCETVCPVNATVHTEEGLNAMAYNRCIGTRYCANNCPYKARRFNFFDYNKRNPLVPHNLNRGPWGKKQVGDGKHLQRNPNVSVRMRGVMEKCTYCVQRLEEAKIKQKQIQRKKALGVDSTKMTVTAKDLRIPVDSVKVACQSACASNAITFGNLLDRKDAAVVRAKDSKRNYDLLNYIGTLPRTSYLARVKNPNKELTSIDKNVGRATIHIH